MEPDPNDLNSYPMKKNVNEAAQLWTFNPKDLNHAHYCTPLEASTEQGKQITYERKKNIIKGGGCFDAVSKS
uniref:Uncharacterized protein n=1 Tax=Panagrolaimus davidi TaxID=227884 RepID=A0A914P7C7_9BILA